MSHHEVIVIGVGCMGSATCSHLARRGVDVLGLERHSIPHDQGSSGHQSRIFRQAYFEHTNYVPLLKRAREGMMELNELGETTVYHETGALYIAPPGGEVVEGAHASALEHDITVERLDAAAIMDRYPMFTLPDDFIGLLEPTAGWVVPEEAIARQVEVARSHGAEIRENTIVTGWSATDAGILVETDAGHVTADRLVISSGAWTSDLLPDLPLQVSRQILGWLQPDELAPFTQGRFPVWAIELEDQSLLYGFPRLDDIDGPGGLKVARHWAAETCHPETVDRSRREGDEDDFLPHIARLLPTAVGPVSDIRICLYTNTPDGHFIIDRHPEHDNVVFAAGFSGHGFKFHSVIGEVLADLATVGSTPHPVSFLRLDRFTSG